MSFSACATSNPNMPDMSAVGQCESFIRIACSGFAAVFILDVVARSYFSARSEITTVVRVPPTDTTI